MALLNPVYRDQLFPREAYRRAFEALRASLPDGDMVLVYLRSFLTDRCPSRRAFTTEQCQAVLKAPG